MKKIILLFVFLAGFVFPAQLLHQRIESLVNNQSIPFGLELKDILSASINSVELNYKGDTDTAYTAVGMTPLGVNQYLLAITPILNDAQQFQYYFSVQLKDGSVYTLPEVFPQENCFVADIKKSETDPRVKLINPSNKSFVDDSMPVIMISYEDPYEILDQSTIKLILDGRDVTKESNLYSRFLSYVPPSPLSEESQHSLEFSVNDHRGQTYEVKSSFTYRPRVPSLIDYKGSLTGIVDLYASDVSPNTRPGMRLKTTLEMSLKGGPVNADIYDYETSEESPTAQRQGRQKLTVYDEKGYIKLGLRDSSPLLSSYTLNGINVDGVNLALGLPGLMTFTYVKGDTQRVVAGDVSNNGTFAQRLSAYQLALKLPFWESAFTLLNIKDDKASIASTVNWGTTKPQENIVAGWFNRFNFSEDQLIYLKSDLAGSLYYSDISTGDTTSIPTEAKQVIPEFILNNVPIRTSMQGGVAGMIEWGTPIGMKEFYLKTYGRFASIGFKTLGNTSIKTDDLMGGLSLKTNFLRGALSFSGSYDKSRDNFLGAFQTSTSNTNYSDDFKGMANMDVFWLANLGLNYNLSLKTNDYAPTSAAYVKNQTQTSLLSLSNIRMEIGKFLGKLNTNYSVINYGDDVSSSNSFDQTALGLAVDTEFEPIKARFSYSISDKDNKGVTPSRTSYMSYGVRLDYDYIPKIMSAYGSIAIQTGLNNGNDSSKVLQTNKTSLALGGIYKFPGRYILFYDTKLYVDVTLSAANDKKADASDRSKNYSEQTLIFKLVSTF